MAVLDNFCALTKSNLTSQHQNLTWLIRLPPDNTYILTSPIKIQADSRYKDTIYTNKDLSFYSNMPNFFSRFIGNSPDTPRAQPISPQLNWILKGELAVGPIPLDKQRQSLLIDSKIRSILTLCSEAEGTPPSSLTNQLNWQRIPLQDSHSDRPVALIDLEQAVDQAQKYIQSSAPLYVHCVAGMERSPSVCVGYLYKYKSMELWEALNWVKQANPRTNILDSQLKAIQQLRK